MVKVFSSLAILLLCACNGSSTGNSKNDSTASTSTTAHRWSKDDEQEFINGCIEASAGKMSDTAAYSYCKCLLGKVQQKFPTLDSTVAVLKDTTEAAKIAEGCK